MARAIVKRRFDEIPPSHEWFRSARDLNEARFLAYAEPPGDRVYIIKWGARYSLYRKKAEAKGKAKAKGAKRKGGKTR